MKIGKFGKKGELTSGQLVSIIILIISFVVIMIFFFVINPKHQVTSESCRNSVLLRSSTSAIGNNVKLDCATQNTCISAGSACDNYQGDKDVQVLKATDKTEELDQLSELIYNCWWMTGEGKVDYAPSSYGFGSDNYCNICNRVKFDQSIRTNKELNQISVRDLYQYMANKQAPDGQQSYLHFLFQTNSLDAARDSIKSASGGYDLYQQTIDLEQNQEYVIITGINKQGQGPALVVGGVAATAGVALAIAALPASAVSFAGIVATYKTLGTFATVAASATKWGTGGTWVGLYLTRDGKNYLSPMIYPYNEDTFKKLDCKEFTSLS